MSESEKMMTALEESATFVALMTGLRQQFIAAGWTPRGAEEMVYAQLIANLGGKS